MSLILILYNIDNIILILISKILSDAKYIYNLSPQ